MSSQQPPGIREFRRQVLQEPNDTVTRSHRKRESSPGDVTRDLTLNLPPDMWCTRVTHAVIAALLVVIYSVSTCLPVVHVPSRLWECRTVPLSPSFIHHA